MPNESLNSPRPEERLLYFNGIDGRNGDYLLPPAPPRSLADFACGAAVDPARIRELQAWVARGEGKARRGLKEGLDPGKLDEAGWGVIFPSSTDSVPLQEALAPLLDLRRSQLGSGRNVISASSSATTATARARARLRSLPATAPGPDRPTQKRCPITFC